MKVICLESLAIPVQASPDWKKNQDQDADSSFPSGMHFIQFVLVWHVGLSASKTCFICVAAKTIYLGKWEHAVCKDESNLLDETMDEVKPAVLLMWQCLLAPRMLLQ